MSEEEANTRIFLPLAILLVTLIVSAAAWAERGLKDNQHPGPVPQGVTMVQPDFYIVKGSKVAPTTLCPVTGQYNPIARVAAIPKTDQSVVECVDGQQWNVHNGPPQSFVPDGLVGTVESPWYWGLAGVLFILFMPWGYFVALRRQSKAEVKREVERLNEARQLLVAQWAKSDHLDLDDPGFIDQAAFEKRLGELDEKIERAKGS